MIRDQFLIVLTLLAAEMSVVYLSHLPRFRRMFKFIPAVFWIYFLPMLLSNFGVIDNESGIYRLITENFLSASLFLLLISSDVGSILRLGKPALIMMFAGSLGIVLGAPLAFWVLKGALGYDFWSGFGAISGSWTGGSANMIAVKEALGTPEQVFLKMVIVDTLVPYIWMGVLVFLSAFQDKYDRFNRCDRRLLDELNLKVSRVSENSGYPFRIFPVIGILLAAAAGSCGSRYLAGFFPDLKDVISGYAWSIIIVSLAGCSLSFTPLRRLEKFGASRIGYLFLYFVLASIGARAGLSGMGNIWILIAGGFLIIFCHAAVVLITSRIIRAPMFLVAVASQANIGGVASAPIIASVYQPALASVGLLLAVMGNIMGTYFGIISGHLCRWVGGL